MTQELIKLKIAIIFFGHLKDGTLMKKAVKYFMGTQVTKKNALRQDDWTVSGNVFKQMIRCKKELDA